MSSRSAVRDFIMAAALLASMAWSQTAYAQQALSLNVGALFLENDVLRKTPALYALDTGDFTGVTVGAEWLTAVGRHIEVGVGIDHYSDRVPRYHLDFDSDKITQDFLLRVTPVTFTVRFVGFGMDAPLQPYIGGGIGVLNWRYGEEAERLDYRTGGTYLDDLSESGTTVGSVILGGLRIPLGTDFMTGIELRYLRAVGGAPELGPQFLTDRLDLGGLATRFVFQVRF